MKPKNQPIDPQEMIKKCTNEINAVLARYQLDLDIEVVLRAGTVEPRLRLIPRQKDPTKIQPSQASTESPEDNKEETKPEEPAVEPEVVASEPTTA